MNKPIVEEHQTTVPFGSGSLVLVCTMERPGQSYGEFPVVRAKILSFNDTSGPPVLITNLSDLKVIAQEKNIDVPKEFGSRPVDYANLIAYFEDIGTVLQPSWRHQVFQERYGIDLLSNQPRVEGQNFRFLTVDLDIRKTPHLVKDITLNLVNFCFAEKELKTI